MSVLLRRSNDLPGPRAYDAWITVSGHPPPDVSGNQLAGLSSLLEDSFDAAAPEWQALAKILASEPTSELAQMPGCAPTCCDFGLMLAWSNLVKTLADNAERVLLICDDPWLFRHLAGLPNIEAGGPPSFWPISLKLAMRGFMVKAKVSMRSAFASLAFRHHRSRMKTGETVILVYGHPDSPPGGDDAYFGPLMNQIPKLFRVLHVDGSLGRAKSLSAGPRTVSLHAWGNPLAALILPFARWKPPPAHLNGPLRWLVKRAVALEGGSGQASMSRWQQICQKNWLKQTKPRLIAWPWENHVWERGFVRSARAFGVRTLGYLHTPHGRHHWGISPASNRDGLDSIPDEIVCTGTIPAKRLQSLGYPPDHISVGGSLRHVVFGSLPHDPNGPVLMALPNNKDIAIQMEKIAARWAKKNKTVLIKPHPMAPAKIRTLPDALYTEDPLDQLPPLSAVVYAMSSIGLEALAGGLPVIRFNPGTSVAPIAALPKNLDVPATNAQELEDALRSLNRPKTIDIAEYYSAPDFEFWDRALNNGLPETQLRDD